ncbi:MAG: hypothetical protein RIQ79_1929 [Verrucomicrobiota bacterium]|jgi:hypothetical protein
MKKILVVFCLFIASRCLADDGLTAFQTGLQSFRSTGAESLLRSWLNTEEQSKIAHIREDLTKITKGLGPVVDTQIFKPKALGPHVLRLYGVIYFEKKPLWIRAEYYSIGEHSGFTSLEYSLSADDILPLEWASTQ